MICTPTETFHIKTFPNTYSKIYIHNYHLEYHPFLAVHDYLST